MTPNRSDKAVQECRRCGTCCKKGGPALHVEDRDLVENGQLPLTDLYTLRRGEMARDNVRGTLQPLKEEIIKVKARQAGGWTCRYYADHRETCRIYSTRPIECRALQCWDTREIERMYALGRLCRKDLLERLDGLWDLVEEHERRCSYEKLDRFTRQLKKDGNEIDADKVLEILQYDTELRNLVIERGGLDPQMLDFLFGRPLAKTVDQFGIRLERKGAKITRLVFNASPAAGRQTDRAKASK